MRFLSLLSLLLIFGCDEFYDEEFEEFEQTRSNSVGNVTYVANLQTTDSSIPDMEGSVTINVRDETVTIDLDINGIPQNFIQIHYSFLNADCLEFERALSGNVASTRTFDSTETISLDALADDLVSAGTATSEGDTDLNGKSFVVKAFPHLSGIPNPQGTNELTIACGELVISENAGDNTDVFTPDTTPNPTPIPTDTGEPFPFPSDAGDVGTEGTGTTGF